MSCHRLDTGIFQLSASFLLSSARPAQPLAVGFRPSPRRACSAFCRAEPCAAGPRAPAAFATIGPRSCPSHVSSLSLTHLHPSSSFPSSASGSATQLHTGHQRDGKSPRYRYADGRCPRARACSSHCASMLAFLRSSLVLIACLLYPIKAEESCHHRAMVVTRFSRSCCGLSLLFAAAEPQR